MASLLSPRLGLIDEWIRTGRGAEARFELEAVLRDKIPREDAITIATLAWRLSLPQIGLKVLHPIVRPGDRSLTAANDLEKVEYAACLVKVGAAEEALTLLEPIDPSRSPRSLLIRTFALMSQWNYADVIPLLERYVTNAGLTEYQRLVGKVNLSAALVYERHHLRASDLLQSLIEESRGQGYSLLLGNCLELLASNFILQKNSEEGSRYLELAHQALKGAGNLDAFFVKKWTAISNLLTAPKDSAVTERLHAIRNEARERGHWETLRDCDRYEAVATHNLKLLHYLYFGTPFASFRTRLLRDFEFSPNLPPAYAWELGPGGREQKELSLLVEGNRRQLKFGQVLHRSLTALTDDFYRPIRVAPLHSRLYPDEYYNPHSAPARVYTAIRRLRKWLQRRRMPLEVRERSGHYELFARRPIRILLPQTDPGRIGFTPQLLLLERTCSKQAFTAQTAAKQLKISTRTALRLLKSGMNSGLVERSGRRALARYSFKM